MNNTKYTLTYNPEIFNGWLVGFEALLKKCQEKEKYDKIWLEIKKKNNW